jgi:hypothetical protein
MQNSNVITQLSNPKQILTGNGVETVYTFRQAYPFTVTNGKLYLSLYSCFISTYQQPVNVSGAITTAGEYNFVGSFNTGLLKQLAIGDTLLYEDETVLFNKK